MQRLEVSGAVRPLYGSLGVKGLNLSGVSAATLTRTGSIFRANTQHFCSHKISDFMFGGKLLVS